LSSPQTSTQTIFGFQQGVNKETNKAHNWLGAIVISNYETMWLAHDSQAINHMTRAKKDENSSDG
jgi:hypothetical protein